MEREEIKELAKELLGPNTLLVDAGPWVSMPCPLAPWTHQKGKDEHPSAGISVRQGEQSVFNCFTCHKKGPVSWLLRTYSEYSGEDYHDLADAVERDSFFGGSAGEWRDSDAPVGIQLKPIDKEAHFDLYESAVGHPYLAERGISNWAAREAELLFDPGDGHVPRILFPVYGYDKQLYGFSGRAVRKTRLKVKDYFGLPKKHLLLGAHLIHPDDQYVILVEGLVDYAKMLTYGYPAMAFMSSTLTEEQAEIVKDIGKPVYFFHDEDEAGRDARDRAKDLLCRHLPVMKVRYPKEDTVETPEGDLRPPQDPAELTRSQVAAMIADARLL